MTSVSALTVCITAANAAKPVICTHKTDHVSFVRIQKSGSAGGLSGRMLALDDDCLLMLTKNRAQLV